MGRDVKRVPLNFDWPLHKVWQGFLMPDSLRGERCPACCGHGDSPAAQWLLKLCYQIKMLAGDVRDQEQGKPMHPWLTSNPHPPIEWNPLAPGEERPFVSDDYTVIRPTEDIITLFAALSGKRPEQIGGLGGGNIEYDLWKAIVNASGLEHWGSCENCFGYGALETYPGQRGEAEAWESTEPPKGEGWQLWETVSEGSPISPVFETAEGLAQWLTTPDACWGAMDRPMTIEQARGFVSVGWAPTGIANVGGVHDGAEYVGTEEVLRDFKDDT